MHDRWSSTPTIGKHPDDAYVIGKGIKLQRKNALVMIREGWLEIINRPQTQYGNDEYTITAQGISSINNLREEDFKPKTTKPYFTASEIAVILREWHGDDGGWIFLTEFAVDGRRIDAYALGLWESTRFLSVGYEIKVNRGDLLSELKEPEKRAVAMQYCHQFYFVTIKGLAHHTEFPQDCGLIEIWKNKSRHIVVDAPIRDVGEPSWKFAGRIAKDSCRQYHQRYDWMNDRWVGECRPMPELEQEDG